MSGCACVRTDTDDTVELATLLRHIAPSVPEIPFEMALDMLREAYKEFARMSSLLVAHQEIHVQRDVRDYAIQAPDGYEVYGVFSMQPGERGYYRVPNANHWFYSWGERFRIEGNSFIHFDTAPSKDYVRHIALRVIPTDCADTIPTEIATPFGKGIAMGALADILEMPNKAWSNPRLASVKRREFSRTNMSGRNLHITNRGAREVMFQPVRIL